MNLLGDVKRIPLTMACAKQYENLLIRHGTNVNISGQDGNIPLVNYFFFGTFFI